MQNKIATLAMIMIVMIGMTGFAAATYTSTMLDNKVGYGSAGSWDLTPCDDICATLVYGDSGDEFVWHVSGTVPSSMAGENYSLIYYADPWPGDNPGALIGEITTEAITGDFDVAGSTTLVIGLPCTPDANMNISEHNYSGAPDYYAHATGAKLWMVPSDDYAAPKMTAWNPSKYLFETDLITYTYTIGTQAAGDGAVISIGNSFVCEGNVESITMPIVISNSINVGSVDLTLTYDESLVTVTGVTNGDMDKMLAPFGDGQVHIITYQEDNPGIGVEFDLAYITFVPDETNTGICDLEITVTSFVDGTFYTVAMPNVISNGTFYIDEYTIGDVNYNGAVDSGDVMVLSKYILGIDGFENINKCAADIDCDSEQIGVNDVAYLVKYLHGMPDYTLPCVPS